jgi:hypothetical protein
MQIFDGMNWGSFFQVNNFNRVISKCCNISDVFRWIYGNMIGPSLYPGQSNCFFNCRSSMFITVDEQLYNMMKRKNGSI